MPYKQDAVTALERDLRSIFGSRLQSLVVYGAHAHERPAADDHGHHRMPATALTRTLVVVDQLSAADLAACAGRMAAWHDSGLATPLVLATHEFERSLDAFPFEFGQLIADHTVAAGSDPFEGLTVDPADLRRACEVQARSHLLHLREGYIETRGNHDALAVLVVESAPALAALLVAVARLQGADVADAAAAARHVERALGLDGSIAGDIVGLVGLQEISSTEAVRLFGPYLDATQRLVKWVDGL